MIFFILTQIKPNTMRKVLHIASSEGSEGFLLQKGGGLLPIMAYMGRWEQGTFSGFRYIKGNLQVERYEREGKSNV